jgi:hypothetical protein
MEGLAHYSGGPAGSIGTLERTPHVSVPLMSPNALQWTFGIRTVALLSNKYAEYFFISQ